MNNLFEGHKITYASKKKYPAIWLDGKLIRIHTIIMERKLGRSLKPKEVVHHIDGDVNNFNEDNLICFASNADHAGYHMGNEIYFDNENIAHCVFTEIRLGKGRYKSCPKCGKLMSRTAKLCKQCYAVSKRPTKDTLTQELAELMSYTAVGAKYGVSGNAVKKWCKYYGIYEKKISNVPSKYEFMKYLETHTLTEAAIYYGVSKSTVSYWVEHLHICICEPQILCVETNTLYLSGMDVAHKLFPEMNPNGVSTKLRKVLDTDKTYKRFHWKTTPRLVTSN